MADRGTQVAVQNATQYDVDAFEHVQEPAANFANTFTAIYYGPW